MPMNDDLPLGHTSRRSKTLPPTFLSPLPILDNDSDGSNRSPSRANAEERNDDVGSNEE
jgi:hypothetical protein